LNRIEARDEQIEIEEIQKILDGGRNDTSILVFAFDLKNFLHIWVLHDECIYKKSDTRLETLLLLIIELLRRKNVSVNRDSSFSKLDSVASNNDQMILPLAMPYQKYAAKSAIENTTNNSNLTNREILQQLFMLLFYPVKDYVQGNKLIIVPDKHLFFAPFSSLVDENGCYLSHSYSTQITPSLHTLKSSMQRSYDSNIGFALFVGNPTVGEVCLNGEVFTPIDLPSAAEEVKCLSKLFDTRALLGPDARKEVVLQLLSGASIIHIAAHGEPNRGEIMLAPNTTKPESYLLTQRDITNISLQARLVVLCCCHTGQGEISSEGVIGITRAFLAAGARSVLAALWPINDDATKVFMEKFYKELCKEISVCEALRRTMNVFQKHEKEEFRAIRIWAPFTIYGEDVKFQKDEIEKIRGKSRKMFSDFVVLS
jgi:CHAT domain-containing protein